MGHKYTFHRNIGVDDVRLTFFTRHMIYQVGLDNTVYRTDISLVNKNVSNNRLKLKGLKHIQKKTIIDIKDITNDIELYFKNGKPMYQLLFSENGRDILWDDSIDNYCYGISKNFLK
jgi:hypothetical protein